VLEVGYCASGVSEWCFGVVYMGGVSEWSRVYLVAMRNLLVCDTNLTSGLSLGRIRGVPSTAGRRDYRLLCPPTTDFHESPSVAIP